MVQHVMRSCYHDFHQHLSGALCLILIQYLPSVTQENDYEKSAGKLYEEQFLMKNSEYYLILNYYIFVNHLSMTFS